MNSLHLSLMEPVMLLRNQFREYVIAKVQQSRQPSAVAFPNMSWDLNYTPIMEELLKEIFESDSSFKAIGHLSPAAQLLVQAGMDRASAEYLALQAFKATLDILVTFLPDLQFGNTEGYQYGFCNDFDAVIMPPVYYADAE